MDLSVVAPAFNEENNLPELTRRILDTFRVGGLEGELILVDDGSQDRSAEVIRELMQAHPDAVIGQFHEKNQGIAGAWRTGVAVARGVYVVVIDADLQYQPEDILRLYRALLESSVDVVQGWRSPVGRERDTRYFMSRTLNHTLNGLFGMKLRDNKSGFVCTRREVLDDLLRYEGRYAYWQSFIMVAAHAKGYSYKEVEVLFERRRQGNSFLETQAYWVALRSLADLARAGVEYRLNAAPRDIYRRFSAAPPPKQREQRPPSPQVAPWRWRAYMATFSRTHWMITEDVEKYYEALQRSQWLAPSDMRALQDEKLYFDIMSENHDKRDVLRVCTSGSTGEPFVVFADRAQLEFRWAATLRAQEWTGYRFGDPTVRLWHQTIGMNKSQVLKERADAVLSNRTFIPVFEMSDAKLKEMVELIAKQRPVLIDGYAEALDFLAQFIRAYGELGFRARAVMSSAQSLPARSREVIENAFGCRVFDKYGSREFSGIAYECEAHSGHHVVSEGYIVELLVDGRPARPGEIGELVITDLNNSCMPFIRYRIGDLAQAMEDEPCACGRGMPKIGEIQGRVQSIIQGLDGRYVPGSFFLHSLKEYEYAIARFQVVQDEPGAIRFLVVKAGRYSDDVLEEVKALIRAYLGEGLRIDVEFVDNVELIHTGKRLATVSHLPIDYQSLGAAAQSDSV
jgi:phenylacetate-CoA ligase